MYVVLIAEISFGQQDWCSIMAHKSIYHHKCNSLFAAIL